MKTKLLNALATFGITLAVSACGTNQDNLDILNSTNFPTLNGFSSTIVSFSGNPFSAASPYWLLNSGGYGNYLSPARGVVGEIGASAIIPNSSYVTIIHSGRLATRVHGLQIVNSRPGDSIAASGTIGSFITTTQIAFQVIVDGTPVCPLSFVSSSLRSNLTIVGLACQ